jgi:Hydantoinase/oxoprolinase N-terminal region
MRWRVGIDTGGTFTDVALVEEETGRIGVAKVATTPRDFAEEGHRDKSRFRPFFPSSALVTTVIACDNSETADQSHNAPTRGTALR